jgi:hypothetical protein
MRATFLVAALVVAAALAISVGSRALAIRAAVPLTRDAA